MDEHKRIEPSAVPAADPIKATGSDASVPQAASEATAAAGDAPAMAGLAQVESPGLVPAMTGAAGVEAAADSAAPQDEPRLDAVTSGSMPAPYGAGAILLVPAIEVPREAERASRWPRFSMLAASVAAVLAVGAVAGAVAMSGGGPVAPPKVAPASPAPASVAASSAAPAATATAATDSASLHAEIARLRAEVASLKASVDSANRSTGAQFAKLAERIDHAQSDLAARPTKTADQLERHADAATPRDVTGSIPSASPAPAAAAAVPAAPPAPVAPPTVPGWVLRDVYHGAAILQGRMGALIELAPGDVFPGIGRVESIHRQDGHWVVLTSRGMITSMR